MATRNFKFNNKDFYHIFNRGTEKRTVFNDKKDYLRFKEIILELNTQKSSGGLFSLSFDKRREKFEGLNPGKLVEIVSYNLLPNHYHLILKQVSEGGISKFMQKIGTGYTNYFNERNDRTGSLFQGKFKAVEVDSDDQLSHLAAYVNYNHLIHGINNPNTIYSSILDFEGSLPKNTPKLSNFESFQGFLGTFEEFKKGSQFSLKYSIGLKEQKKRGKGVWLED